MPGVGESGTGPPPVPIIDGKASGCQMTFVRQGRQSYDHGRGFGGKGGAQANHGLPRTPEHRTGYEGKLGQIDVAIRILGACDRLAGRPYGRAHPWPYAQSQKTQPPQRARLAALLSRGPISPASRPPSRPLKDPTLLNRDPRAAKTQPRCSRAATRLPELCTDGTGRCHG